MQLKIIDQVVGNIGIGVERMGVGVEEISGMENKWGWGGSEGQQVYSCIRYLLESQSLTRATPGIPASLFIKTGRVRSFCPLM